MRRKREHQRSSKKWERMVVKYKTCSVNSINRIETIFVDHHWEYLQNEVGGGGGPNGNAPYFLYVLLRGKYRINND